MEVNWVLIHKYQLIRVDGKTYRWAGPVDDIPVPPLTQISRQVIIPILRSGGRQLGVIVNTFGIKSCNTFRYIPRKPNLCLLAQEYSLP